MTTDQIVSLLSLVVAVVQLCHGRWPDNRVLAVLAAFLPGDIRKASDVVKGSGS